MSDTVGTGSLSDALAGAHLAVDRLQSVELARDTDEALVDGLRELERLARRVDSASHGLINEVGRRGLPESHGCRSMGRFLRHLLQLDAHDAGTRAAAAAAAGPRRALTGEPLAPVFEAVAAGQAAGVVSQRQARVIVHAVEDLPDAVQAVHGVAVERELVGFAGSLEPGQLAQLGRRIGEHLNPDGVFDEPDEIARHRALTLDEHADGTSTPRGRFSPELTERLRTLFDVLAAPRPASGEIKDARTLPQRQHDALLDLCERAVRGGEVASNNGVSATIVVTMTAEQYATGTGLARTGHGAGVPAADALRWSGGDTEVLAVVLGTLHEITHYSHTQRIFTEAQRRVIAARDGGCTFPGCPEPPGRCQVDHVTRHEHGGPTRVDNGALECRYHHREAAALGYRPVMINSIPHWIPPPWIDPAQTPIRNTLHDDRPSTDDGRPRSTSTPPYASPAPSALSYAVGQLPEGNRSPAAAHRARTAEPSLT